MNWKLKSAIQRACSALPWGSDAVYYGIQRTFGSLREPEPPLTMLSEAGRLVRWLQDAGVPATGKRILEIGTGRRLDLPLGLFLAGAGPIYTCDLHRYLRHPLVRQSVWYMCAHRDEIAAIFLPFVEASVFHSRLESLCRADPRRLLEIAPIRYIAPADAASIPLGDGSVDVHLSYTVFEHIPPPTLASILREARRLLSPDGVALHHIDPSDHFSHIDPSISAINFLQFTDQEWRRYAGNRFAYHNRLRSSQYRALFEDCGYEILRWEETLSQRSLDLLGGGFPLDPQFRPLPPEVLCCCVLRVLARPRADL